MNIFNDIVKTLCRNVIEFLLLQFLIVTYIFGSRLASIIKFDLLCPLFKALFGSKFGNYNRKIMNTFIFQIVIS